ncbi:MAG: LamB/YcsF family protein [Syntrophales bacterium]|nr:LamB/YcsF family protein [Syntrophales bacterium]
MRAIDLNCDMGESFGPYRIGRDEDVIRYITSANIACGFHAADPTVMARTVRLCRDHGVRAGAHPGYPDRVGFGRRFMDIDQEDLINDIVYQVGALKGFLDLYHLPLQHVKLHGALYNYLVGRDDLLLATAAAVQEAFGNPIFLTLATSRGWELKERCRKEGIRLALEAFPDRLYTEEGELAPRKLPGAVIKDPEYIVARALRMAQDGTVETVGGNHLPLSIDTLCLHGDNAESVRAAAMIRRTLTEAGVTVIPMGEFL